MIMESNKLYENFEGQDIKENFVDLDNYNISIDLIRTINRGIASKYVVLPYKENKSELFFAMENPKDLSALNDLKFITQKKL
jgi:type IV pilus assembly protein PilB